MRADASGPRQKCFAGKAIVKTGPSLSAGAQGTLLFYSALVRAPGHSGGYDGIMRPPRLLATTRFSGSTAADLNNQSEREKHTKKLKLGPAIVYICQRTLLMVIENLVICYIGWRATNCATPPFRMMWNLRSDAKSEVLVRKRLASERLDGNYATASEGRCKNRHQDRSSSPIISPVAFPPAAGSLSQNQRDDDPARHRIHIAPL